MAAPQISEDVLLHRASPKLEEEKTCFECKDLSLYYGSARP